MWNKIIFRSMVLLIPLWYSCVPQKKYNEVNIRNAEMMRSLRETEGNLDSASNSLEQFRKKASQLEEELADFKRKNNALETKLERAIAASSSVQQELSAKEQRMIEQQERLDLLQNLLDEQKAVMEGLKTTIDKALVQYRSDELQVYEQDGKLLFPSGSATVNKDGKEALSKLAVVINNSPEIQILVEGHTDNVPIRGKFEDNWALSTARATAIVRILTNSYDVVPERVTAAGRSFYYPKASNETAEGRAKNRRTEIILTPQLNELFQLLR